MKHVSFFQWLINSKINTQEEPGRPCATCNSRGFVGGQNGISFDGGAVWCSICGDERKVAKLEKQYEEQAAKDEKLMAQLQKVTT